MLPLLLWILSGYLLGAIPFGYLVARARGVDILSQGSGNIGATNVGRILGQKFGLLVFFLDFLKGALPTMAARLYSPTNDLPPETVAISTGVASFIGHLFPIYLGFRGGKGVATGAGILAVVLSLPFLGALGVWLAVVLLTRTVSLASIASGLFLLVQRLFFTSEPWSWDNRAITLFCMVTVVLILFRHQANILRLLQGNENRFKETTGMRTLARIVHGLSLGTCFGAQVFFTITGLLIFQSFETESRSEQRPLWFPLPAEFRKDLSVEGLPQPIRLEQGSRAAGFALAPLFPWFYSLQTICCILALASAWNWGGSRIDPLRKFLLVISIFLLGSGWWLERKVHDLRGPRNDTTEAVIQSTNAQPQQIQEAVAARKTFGMWHGMSLLQHFASMTVTGVLLIIASAVPLGINQTIPTGKSN